MTNQIKISKKTLNNLFILHRNAKGNKELENLLYEEIQNFIRHCKSWKHIAAADNQPIWKKMIDELSEIKFTSMHRLQ